MQNSKINFDLKLDVVLISSLLIAVKYIENDPRIPDLRIIYPRNNKIFFSSKEIRQTEIICLKLINYNLSFLSVFDFMDFFLLIGIVEKNEINLNPEILEKMNFQAMNLLYTFISDVRSLNYSDLQIACAIIKLVRELNKFQNKWIYIYQKLFFIEEDFFYDCYESIKSSIYKKKSSSLGNGYLSSTSSFSLNSNNSGNISPIIGNKYTIEFNNKKKIYASNNNLDTYLVNDPYIPKKRKEFSSKTSEKVTARQINKIDLNEMESEKFHFNILNENFNRNIIYESEKKNLFKKNSSNNDITEEILITNNSDKEIVENFFNHTEENKTNNNENGNEFQDINEICEINKNTLTNNLFNNVINNNNILQNKIFSKTRKLIQKKGENKENKIALQNNYRYLNKSNIINVVSITNTEKTNYNKEIIPSQHQNEKNSKEITDNAEVKVSNKNNNINVTNASTNFNLNKTLTKKNRHSHTSHPAVLNEILSKINILENIDEKIVTERKDNLINNSEKEKNLKLKNSLYKSQTTKTEISNKVNNTNKTTIIKTSETKEKLNFSKIQLINNMKNSSSSFGFSQKNLNENKELESNKTLKIPTMNNIKKKGKIYLSNNMTISQESNNLNISEFNLDSKRTTGKREEIENTQKNSNSFKNSRIKNAAINSKSNIEKNFTEQQNKKKSFKINPFENSNSKFKIHQTNSNPNNLLKSKVKKNNLFSDNESYNEKILRSSLIESEKKHREGFNTFENENNNREVLGIINEINKNESFEFTLSDKRMKFIEESHKENEKLKIKEEKNSSIIAESLKIQENSDLENISEGNPISNKIEDKNMNNKIEKSNKKPNIFIKREQIQDNFKINSKNVLMGKNSVDKKILNLKNEINNKLIEINGLTTTTNGNIGEVNRVKKLSDFDFIDEYTFNIKSSRNENYESNANNKIFPISNNKYQIKYEDNFFSLNSQKCNRNNHNKINNSNNYFSNNNNNKNFNSIFDENIKSLEEKFENFKNKIKVKNSGNNNLNNVNTKYKDSSCQLFYQNSNKLNLSNFKNIEDKFNNPGSNSTNNISSRISSSLNNKISYNEPYNKLKIRKSFLEQYLIDNNINSKISEYDLENPSPSQMKSIEMGIKIEGELERSIEKIKNYFKNNRKNKEIEDKGNSDYKKDYSIKQLNTEISNFEMELMNTEMQYNNMLENFETIDNNMDILKTDIPSKNVNFENKNFLKNFENDFYLQKLNKGNKKFINSNQDVTLENIEDSLEKLTTQRKRNQRIKNKTIVNELSADLKAKSKKLRNEMKKISKILETEITETNIQNISVNDNRQISKINKFDNVKENYNQKNLKIITNYDNNNNNNNNYIHKKPILEPSSNKKFNFYKISPNLIKNAKKSGDKGFEIENHSRSNFYSNNNISNNQIVANLQSKLINKNNKNYKNNNPTNLIKNNKLKEFKDEVKINLLDSLTLSELGKSLSNYNRSNTIKSESKVKSFYLDLLKNKQVLDIEKHNKSSNRNSEKLNDNLSNNLNKNHINKKNTNSTSQKNFLIKENKLEKIINLYDDSFQDNLNKINEFDVKNKINKTNTFLKDINVNNKNLNLNKEKINKKLIIHSINNSSSSNNKITNITNNNILGINFNNNISISILDNNQSSDFPSKSNENEKNINNKLNEPHDFIENTGFKNNQSKNYLLTKDEFNKENFHQKCLEKISRINENNNKNNLNSKSINELESVFSKKNEKNNFEIEKKIDNIKSDTIDNNTNQDENLILTSDRNYLLDMKNKIKNEFNHNTLISSISSFGGICNEEQNNKINGKISLNNMNTIGDEVDSNISKNLQKIKSEKTKKIQNDLENNIKTQKFKINSKNSNNLMINTNLNNLNNKNFLNNIRGNKVDSLNNFKNLNDLFNSNNNPSTHSNLNSKNVDYFSLDKPKEIKFSQINPELYIKSGKSTIPSFDYLNNYTNTNSNINGLSNNYANLNVNSGNSINPAIRKINEMKNELSNYTNKNPSKKYNNNVNSISNLNKNFINFNNHHPNCNQTANSNVSSVQPHMTNSNYNFNFNFYNNSNNCNNATGQNIQNINYNYLTNIQNHDNESNQNNKNLNLLMKILENKNDNTVNNVNNNILLSKMKNGTSNKQKFLNLNSLNNNSEFSNINNLNIGMNTSKNNIGNNKINFSNMLDYPTSSKNKNFNFFNFNDNNNKKKKK